MTTASPDLLPRAFTSPAAWLRFLIPAAVGLAGDLCLKAWSFPNGISLGEPCGRFPTSTLTDFGWRENPPATIIPHILGITTTVNQGAVFGSFQGKVTWFLVFSILAMIVILWVFLTSRRNQYVVHITLGMITAGALGNLYDRALFHGVRDMLKLEFLVWHGKDYYPYIFNLADALLCVAVPLLMLRWLFVKEPSKTEAEA